MTRIGVHHGLLLHAVGHHRVIEVACVVAVLGVTGCKRHTSVISCQKDDDAKEKSKNMKAKKSSLSVWSFFLVQKKLATQTHDDDEEINCTIVRASGNEVVYDLLGKKYDRGPSLGKRRHDEVNIIIALLFSN